MNACCNSLILLVLKAFHSLGDWDKIFLVFEKEEIAHYTADLTFKERFNVFQ